MQQWEGNTLAKLQDLKDELKNKANKRLENYESNKKAELTVNQEVLNYKNIIKEDIQKFVQKEKDKMGEEVLYLSEDKLRNFFEEQWNYWLWNLHLHYNPIMKANVEQDIIQILRETAPKIWEFIDEKRKQKGSLSYFKVTDFFIQQKHYKFNFQKAVKKELEKIRKGT